MPKIVGNEGNIVEVSEGTAHAAMHAKRTVRAIEHADMLLDMAEDMIDLDDETDWGFMVYEQITSARYALESGLRDAASLDASLRQPSVPDHTDN